jgi:hypothetical protein
MAHIARTNYNDVEKPEQVQYCDWTTPVQFPAGTRIFVFAITLR